MDKNAKELKLPLKDEAWVKSVLASGEFANSREYIHTLIEQDRKRITKLRSILDEASESGVSHLSRAELLLKCKSVALNAAQGVG